MTIKVAVAAALAEAGSRVLVVDVDPQQSSAWWFEHGREMPFDLAADTDVTNLRRLRELPYNVVLVDTPGSLHDLPVLIAVLDAADFVLLSSKASALSIAPLMRTLNEYVIPRNLPYRVLANKVDPRNVDGRGYRDARALYDVLDGAGYLHFKSYLREYKVYEEAAGGGAVGARFFRQLQPRHLESAGRSRSRHRRTPHCVGQHHPDRTDQRVSGRKDLSAMLGGSVPKAAAPGDTPAAPAPVASPARLSTSAPSAPQSGKARWTTFERKETRLRPDQLEWLEQTRKALNKRRGVGVGERLTDNTLIRLAIDVLRDRENDLNGSTEEELARNLGTQ